MTSRVDRKKHVDAWRRSDLSQDAYCQKNSLVMSTFRNWIRDYAHLGPASPRVVQEVEAPQMVPVKIAPTPVAPQRSGTLELKSPSGYVWSLGQGHSAEWVAELIRRVG
jgi:hypothetical protein